MIRAKGNVTMNGFSKTIRWADLHQTITCYRYMIRGPKLRSLYCLHDIFVYDQGRENRGHAELDHDISGALSAKP